MRILNQNNEEIFSPDESTGYLTADRILIAHHPAVEYVEEKGHYVVEREYPNGGKLMKFVVDVPGVEAKEAWDEYEDILRFVPYTAEELAEMDAPSQMDMIEAQVLYTALMTDTLLEG